MQSTSLRSLISSVRADLTPMHGRLADYCLARPIAAATMGIEELAAAAGVSNATVNRFTRRLGLDGFADFRARAVDDIHRLMSPEEKLEAEAGHHRDDPAIVIDSLEAAIFDLERTRDGLDAAAWSSAIGAIRAAERVIFVGFGLSAVLVAVLADMIEPFCRSELVLDGRGGTERMLRRTLAVGPGDLVIAVSLPRYSKATVEHVSQMRAQGARVLGITDAETSPLAVVSDVALFAAAQHPLLHASATGVVAVFEALHALLAARAQDPRRAAELIRRIRPHLLAGDPPGEAAEAPLPRTTE